MEVAAAEVHVYLKVGPESLHDGRKILAAWGFSRTTLLYPATRPLDPHGSLLTVHDMLLLGARDSWEVTGRDCRLGSRKAGIWRLSRARRCSMWSNG